jgi:hypothetical protein
VPPCKRWARSWVACSDHRSRRFFGFKCGPKPSTRHAPR